MNESMTDTAFDTAKLTSLINDTPIKLLTEATPRHELEALANDIKHSLTPYGTDTRGTCMDERGRACLKSGASANIVRPSAPGGSDIYGLAVRELSGYYSGSDFDENACAADTKSDLNAAGIKSGGHEGCAADNLLGTWAGAVIIANKDEIVDYTQQKFVEDGLNYNPELQAVIIKQAEAIQSSQRYASWTEQSYFDLLGEEAGEAIEVLKAEDHLGIAMAWIDVEGMAMDQTVLKNRVFELNKPYMKRIEASALSTDEAMQLAPYARYAVVKALALALPNQQLQEITVK